MINKIIRANGVNNSSTCTKENKYWNLIEERVSKEGELEVSGWSEDNEEEEYLYISLCGMGGALVELVEIPYCEGLKKFKITEIDTHPETLDYELYQFLESPLYCLNKILNEINQIIDLED